MTLLIKGTICYYIGNSGMIVECFRNCILQVVSQISANKKGSKNI